jgi:hypothetical protein
MFLDSLFICPCLLCASLFLHPLLLALLQRHRRRCQLRSCRNYSLCERWSSCEWRRPSPREKRRWGFRRKPLPRSGLTSTQSGPRPRLLRKSTLTKWWLRLPVLSTPSGSTRYRGRRRLSSMGGSGTWSCLRLCWWRRRPGNQPLGQS